MRGSDSNYDALKKGSDKNENNRHHGRNNNNLLGKKRKNKYKIESTTKLSILRNTPELPWDDIEQEDNENPQILDIKIELLILRIEMNLIEDKINLLKGIKQLLETNARADFDLLKKLGDEISTDASSEDGK